MPINIIIWITVGLFSGWLIATFVKHSTSNLIDIFFTLIGSLAGAFIATSLIGNSATSVFTYIMAACGAVIFLFLGRLRAISK